MSATYDSVAELAAAVRPAAEAHGRHEEAIGHADADRPDWYGQFTLGEQTGSLGPAGEAFARPPSPQSRRGLTTPSASMRNAGTSHLPDPSVWIAT
jgi:hypothetical protein